MKIKALKRTIKTLEEIKSKVDPNRSYNMHCGSSCILGVHYGTFGSNVYTLFKDFNINHKDISCYPEHSVKQIVSNLFYSYKRSDDDYLSGEYWIKECDKVLAKLHKKIAKKTDKKVKVLSLYDGNSAGQTALQK